MELWLEYHSIALLHICQVQEQLILKVWLTEWCKRINFFLILKFLMNDDWWNMDKGMTNGSIFITLNCVKFVLNVKSTNRKSLVRLETSEIIHVEKRKPWLRERKMFNCYMQMIFLLTRIIKNPSSVRRRWRKHSLS